MPKRYFWLRLKDDFFDSKRIKKLRRMAGGDTYTIIYLKMQLKAMKTDGVLRWTGLEDSAADELALDLNEEPDNVKVTLQYLLSCGLAETTDDISFFFPYALENVGSETASAQRVRDFRNRKLLQCNTDETQVKHICSVEKEIEIEKEKEIENSDIDAFDSFWNAYPRKSGDIKQACFEYMGAIQNGATLKEMLDAIEWQKEEKGGRYMPSAEKWLRNKGWTEAKTEPKVDRNAPPSMKYEPVTASDYDFGDKI